MLINLHGFNHPDHFSYGSHQWQVSLITEINSFATLRAYELLIFCYGGHREIESFVTANAENRLLKNPTRFDRFTHAPGRPLSKAEGQWNRRDMPIAHELSG